MNARHFFKAILFSFTIASSALAADIDWVKHQSPALYKGVLRALGPAKTIEFFEGWLPDDVQAIQEKLYTHQKLAIEYITHPEHADDELPRSFFLNLLGPLAEGLGLAQFRKECPLDFHVVADEGKDLPELAPLRRPDGMMIRVVGSDHLEIAGVLESKVSKSNRESFDAVQYSEMLTQWKAGGVYAYGRFFAPEKTRVLVGDRYVSVSDLTVEEFFSSIYLYQPRSTVAPPGLKKLLTGAVDAWAMRFVGLSVASLGLYPLMHDGFLQHRNDMALLVKEMKASPNILSEVALELVKKTSEEMLMAAFSVLDPAQVDHIKMVRRRVVHAPQGNLLHQTPKYAMQEYEDWKSGKHAINDPIRLALLRLKFDSKAVFEEFLISKKRWPENVDLTEAKDTDAVDRIVENRFFETLKRFGGRNEYFTRMLSAALKKQFQELSGWNPSCEAQLHP